MTVEFENPKVTIDDVTYEAELGTVERTHFGPEDHGMLTCFLYFDFEGSGQGFGGYSLDGEFDLTKVVPNYGIKFLKGCMGVGGSYGTWEGLTGQRLYALREQPYGPILGIMSLDRQRTFFPKDLLLS